MSFKSLDELLKEFFHFLETGEEEGCYTLDPKHKGMSHVWSDGIKDFYRRIGEACVLEKQTVYVMRNKTKHYGSLCGACGVRVSMGKKFIIDPVDPKVIYHLGCVKKKKV